MVMRYVKKGMAGQSLLKMGPDRGVPCNVFKLLLTAFETSMEKQTATQQIFSSSTLRKQ